MSANSFFHFLLPKSTKFYDDFNRLASHIFNSSELLKKMIETADEQERQTLSKQIIDFEHDCDKISGHLFSELSKTFITPFDREDIYNLASALDDVQDYIYASSQRIVLLMPKHLDKGIHDLSVLLLKSSEELKNAIRMLSLIKMPVKINECCQNINKIESEADRQFRNAITNLFKLESNPIELIKQKEILEFVEETIDKVEDVTEIINAIIVKNS